MKYDFEKKLKNYFYVSFDVFDTLIKRNVEVPSQIFEIVEREYNKIYGTHIYNFKKERLFAECIARNENAEPDLDDIYNCLKEYTKKLRN